MTVSMSTSRRKTAAPWPPSLEPSSSRSGERRERWEQEHAVDRCTGGLTEYPIQVVARQHRLHEWLLTSLVPLAQATRPDPIWISGIYDGADQDAVIGLLPDD